MGHKYTGIELREEQVLSNQEQAKRILEQDNQPKWIEGDSNQILDKFEGQQIDFIFSCPPYGNLEIYSNMKEDISNMDIGKSYFRYFKITNNTIS